MSVSARPRHRTVRKSGFVVEVDPRLPDAVVGRTVYHSPNGRYLGAAHRHGFPHDLLCLAGTCAVGWAVSDQEPVRWSQLGQGDSIHVAAHIGHRIWLMAGAVLASITPATSWLVTTGVEQLTDDGRWER